MFVWSPVIKLVYSVFLFLFFWDFPSVRFWLLTDWQFFLSWLCLVDGLGMLQMEVIFNLSSNA